MKTIATLLTALLLTTPLVSWGEEDVPPEVSLDGLELVEKNRHKEVYRAPGVAWAEYDSVMIDEATVAFRRNWQRDQNRYQHNKIRTADMERIRNGMAELFDDVFTSELSEQGDYTLAEEAGESVLRIRPHIVDLDVYAPDARNASGMQRSYVETAGRMTLKLELYDSQTGDLLAVASEHKEAPRRGYVQWANQVSNRQEFRLMLQGWARDLREGLESAKSD
jgi:hypothetical protein